MPDNARSDLQPDPGLHITMPFQGRWARKVFVRGLGVPRRHVYFVLRAAKSMLLGKEVAERRRMAESISDSIPDLDIWRHAGHRSVLPEELGDLEPVIRQCRAIYIRAVEEARSNPSPNKSFLRSIASNQYFLGHPDVIRFVLAEPILRAVSAYLGSVPVLSGITLLWSPAQLESTSPTSSQRFHNDHEDLSQVKLFVHVEDVESDHGVFTFCSAELTQKIRRALGTRRGRLNDADVYAVISREDPLTLTGPTGTAAFIDTSRCLHFGSRPSPQDRLILQAQFLRCNSPTYSKLALTLNRELAARAWSPLQRLVLGLRPVDE